MTSWPTRRSPTILLSFHGPVSVTIMPVIRKFFDETKCPIVYGDLKHHAGMDLSREQFNTTVWGAYGILGRLDEIPSDLRPVECTSPPDMLRGEREKEFGRDIATAQHYRDFLAKELDKKPLASYRFLGAWVVPPTWRKKRLPRRASRRFFEASGKGVPSTRRRAAASPPSVCAALSSACAHPSIRTIQVIVGADVLLPHRSITRVLRQ